MIYDKLVRDKIPEYIRSKNGTPKTHIASDAEYRAKLKEKLLEEAGEFERDENEAELADILEVIDAVIDYKKFSKEEIQKIKGQKFAEKGGFKNEIILEES